MLFVCCVLLLFVGRGSLVVVRCLLFVLSCVVCSLSNVVCVVLLCDIVCCCVSSL